MRNFIPHATAPLCTIYFEITTYDLKCLFSATPLYHAAVFLPHKSTQKKGNLLTALLNYKFFASDFNNAAISGLRITKTSISGTQVMSAICFGICH